MPRPSFDREAMPPEIKAAYDEAQKWQNELKTEWDRRRVPVPVPGERGIERINALRNAIGHSFFPENRRQYAGHKKVMYQGENVYTRNGIQKFEEDFKVV